MSRGFLTCWQKRGFGFPIGSMYSTNWSACGILLGQPHMTKNTEAAAAVAKMSPQMFKPEPPSTVCLMHTMSSRAKQEKTGSGGLRRDLLVCLKAVLHLHRSPAAGAASVCVGFCFFNDPGYGSH